MSRRTRLAAGTLSVPAVALAVPAAASAHGLVGKQDLPVPQWMFAWAAATVLVASFVGLSALWQSPRLQRVEEREIARFPRWLEVLCGAIGVAAFAALIYAGFAGAQDAQRNILPTVVFVLFWVGFPFASLLFGDVFAAFNPWRAIGRACGWTLARLGQPPEPLAYPERLGRWPAVAGLFGFAWIELVYLNKDVPHNLAIAALVYAAIQLIGMSLYGERAWTRHADAFGVYFNLIGRLAPLDWTDRRLRVRPPLSGVVGLDMIPGTVALICTAIGSTSFDGFSQGSIWTSIATNGVPKVESLSFNIAHATEIVYTLGLVVAILVIAGLYYLGVRGMRGVDRTRGEGQLGRLFAHSLVPIAMAYVVAHYFSLLAYQGQAIASLASDPLGHGSNLLGTASATINYTWIGATGIWYVQVGALILGHVAGLILAHDRAIDTYADARVAARSQYWMLGVMVCFTCLALYLLSAASQ